jgi:hypothetical protein
MGSSREIPASLSPPLSIPDTTGRPRKARRLNSAQDWQPPLFVNLDRQDDEHLRKLFPMSLSTLLQDTNSTVIAHKKTGFLASIKHLLRIIPHEGDEHKSAASAKFMAEHQDCANNIEQIRMLYNSLPALQAYEEVYFDINHNVWVVNISTIKRFRLHPVLPLFIDGCPVYILQNWQRELAQTCPATIDAWPDLHPHMVASEDDIWRLRSVFPTAMGIRVHKWGLVEILFETQEARQSLLSQPGVFPGQIGGMPWQTQVVQIEPTTSEANMKHVGAGTQVASKPEENSDILGCLGLRIRPEGSSEDAWTTTTHAWTTNILVTTVKAIKNRKWSMLMSIRKHKWLSKQLDKVREACGRAVGTYYIIGTPIFLADSKAQIGSISRCYDILPLPEAKQFPAGYKHDLSLITGPNLPDMALPGCVANLLPTFATPDVALNSREVFSTHFRFRLDKTIIHEGTILPGKAVKSLVVGMDYYWHKDYLRKAIIWRTMADDADDADARGSSGSALCIGTPGIGSCQAFAFQNFQTYYLKNQRFLELDPTRIADEISSQLPQSSVKGAFLLPEDIQNGRIITPDEVVRRRVVSGPGHIFPRTRSDRTISI